MELKKLNKLVIQVLKDFEFTRGNDDLLYLNVLILVDSKANNTKLITTMTLSEFYTNRQRCCFPSFESVSRCRRKIQEEHPELKPSKRGQEARKRQEEKFYNYATKQAEFSF